MQTGLPQLLTYPRSTEDSWILGGMVKMNLFAFKSFRAAQSGAPEEGHCPRCQRRLSTNLRHPHRKQEVA